MKTSQLHELLTTSLTDRIQRSHFALLNQPQPRRSWWQRCWAWLAD